MRMSVCDRFRPVFSWIVSSIFFFTVPLFGLFYFKILLIIMIHLYDVSKYVGKFIEWVRFNVPPDTQ